MGHRRGNHQLLTVVAGVHEPALGPNGASAGSRTSGDSRLRTTYLALAALTSAAALVAAAIGPIRDVDLPWHLLLGRELNSGTPVMDAGRGWTFAPVDDTWTSTQWLGERVLASVDALGGLDAFIVIRVLSVALILLALAWSTLMRHPLRAAVVPFVLTAVMVTMTAQERTQQLTFTLLPIIGVWAVELLRRGRVPRWWLVLPLVLVWSQVHGGWFLLPAALVLAAAGRAMDAGPRDPAVGRTAGLAGVTILVACVSPAGWGNLIALVRMPLAATGIEEWQRVQPWNLTALCLLLMTLAVLLSWVLGAARPTRGELLLVLALIGFGLMAWRNLAPAMLLLAPVAAGILSRALNLDDAPDLNLVPRAAMRTVTVGLVLALAFSVLLSVRQAPVVNPGVPQRLIDEIASSAADQRVLDTYNVAGWILFSGQPPHVRVAIDGRADLYGAEYRHAYQTDLLGAAPGWRDMLDSLRPTCALLRQDEALAGVLVAERGWVPVDTEGDYVLLHAPGAPGWSTG